MAISRVHVWSPGEVLLATDLNAEYNNILTNAADLVSPFTKAVSMGGFPLYFDAANTIAFTAATNGVSLTGGALNTPQGADIVAAATLNLDTATGNSPDVTGNTGITAVTLSVGRWRLVRFTGTPTITNGASLVVEGGADYTAVAGQYVLFVGYAGSVVRCIPFTTPAATQTLTNKTIASSTLTNPANTVQVLTDAATIAWDTSLGAMGTVTLTASRIVGAPTGLKAGGRYWLLVTQNGTGGWTLTYNAVFKGIIPQPDPTIAATTLLAFDSDGTNLYIAQPTSFIDSNAVVRGSADGTKKVRFEVDGLTTGTTRVLTVQDSDDTLVGRATTDTLTNKTLTSPVVNTGVTGTAIADQTAMEAASSTSLIVPPGNTHFHPGVAKAFGKCTPAATVNASYPAGATLTKNGTGDYTVTFGRTFSASTYSVLITMHNVAASYSYEISTVATTTFRVLFVDASTTAVDPGAFSYVIFGDL